MTNALYSVEAISKSGTVSIDSRDDLAIDVSAPPELGGEGDGMNPERLYAAALASCLHQAVVLAATAEGVDPSDSAVTATATLDHDGTQRYSMNAQVTIHLPGASSETEFESVAEQAMRTCPMVDAVSVKRADAAMP